MNITVNIAKDVKGRLNIFPIINNAERLAFNSKVGSDDFNYYIPSSIGESGFLAAHLKNILKNEKIESNDINLEYIGIPISNNKGELHLRAYMNKMNNRVEINNPVLIFIYYIEIFGYDYLWYKVVHIELEK